MALQLKSTRFKGKAKVASRAKAVRADFDQGGFGHQPNQEEPEVERVTGMVEARARGMWSVITVGKWGIIRATVRTRRSVTIVEVAATNRKIAPIPRKPTPVRPHPKEAGKEKG